MSLVATGAARAYNAADFALSGPVSTTKLLFSIWVKSITGANTPGYIMNTDANASGSLNIVSLGIGIFGATAGDPYVGAAATNGTPTYSPGSPTVGQDGSWQNLVFHVDGAANRVLYINGSAQTANTNTRDITGIERIQFFGVANSGETAVSAQTAGYIAYPAIFDVTSLSSGQISTLITELQTLKPSAVTSAASILHYWPMDGADTAACLVATTGSSNLTVQTVSGGTLVRDEDNPTLSDGASAVVKRLMTMGIGS